MVSLTPVTSELFGELHEALLRDWNPLIGRAAWEHTFAVNPSSEEDYSGYALTDGGKIVGVSGMIFSRRTIRGKVVRFCNLHGWIVNNEYRSKSLLLLKPVLSLKDHTLTDFTAGEGVAQIMKRFGLVDLDHSALALPQLPWQRGSGEAQAIEMTDPPEQYAAELDPADLQIYRDHQGIGCGHLLLRTAGECCYVVYSRIAPRLRLHAYVHYMSNPRLFVEHHAAIRRHLMRETNTRFVVVDRRMLADFKVPFSFRVRSSGKLFRSQHVEASEVDTLYSEMVYLKHSTLASLVPRFLRTARH